MLLTDTNLFKGNYTIKDFNVGDKDMPMVVPTGIYRTKVSYMKDGQNVFGYTIVFNVGH